MKIRDCEMKFYLFRARNASRRTMKSLRWKDESTIHPSAASSRSEMTREEKTRHQVNVVTGADAKNYWEADVSVDKVRILEGVLHMFSSLSQSIIMLSSQI